MHAVALREFISMGAADILTGGVWGAQPPEKARRRRKIFGPHIPNPHILFIFSHLKIV